jgi:hypothetical protein
MLAARVVILKCQFSVWSGGYANASLWHESILTSYTPFAPTYILEYPFQINHTPTINTQKDQKLHNAFSSSHGRDWFVFP